MTEIAKTINSDQKFLQRWAQEFKYIFPRYVIMASAACGSLMINTAFASSPETSAQDRSSTSPYAQEAFSFADPQVLWDAAESGKLILLGPKAACPQGGTITSEPVTYDIANSNTNRLQYTLRPQTIYKMQDGDSIFGVACVYDTGEGDTRFTGSGVIAIETTKIKS
jgi:hypothetical protein